MFVCLFVLHAFGHGTTKCNEILYTIPFRPEEGHRIVFDQKFLLERGVFHTLVGFTTLYAFFRKFFRMILSIFYLSIYISTVVCLSVWPRTPPTFVDRFSWKRYQIVANFSAVAANMFFFKFRPPTHSPTRMRIYGRILAKLVPKFCKFFENVYYVISG